MSMRRTLIRILPTASRGASALACAAFFDAARRARPPGGDLLQRGTDVVVLLRPFDPLDGVEAHQRAGPVVGIDGELVGLAEVPGDQSCRRAL